MDSIEMMFKFMEYDVLSDSQLKLVESFEEQFNESGSLSERQEEILESIFKQAAERA